MNSLEAAILRTVLYADVFNFAMTREEIHHFLIYEQSVPQAAVNTTLQSSPLLDEHLIQNGSYVACRRDLIADRAKREQDSQRLWPLAMRYGVWLGAFAVCADGGPDRGAGDAQCGGW